MGISGRKDFYPTFQKRDQIFLKFEKLSTQNSDNFLNTEFIYFWARNRQSYIQKLKIIIFVGLFAEKHVILHLFLLNQRFIKLFELLLNI